VQVSPHQPAYLGPVVVLASPYTISAGDEIVMLLRDYPNVVVIGDTTAGAYSDTLGKRLPNGWRITLSNEIYVAPDGGVYEGPGIPPHIRVPYFPNEVRRTGIDALIEKAREVLALMRADGSGMRFPAPARIGDSARCTASSVPR
jgi:C-terminal processing protease CtpA/Prc